MLQVVKVLKKKTFFKQAISIGSLLKPAGSMTVQQKKMYPRSKAFFMFLSTTQATLPLNELAMQYKKTVHESVRKPPAFRQM